jgi:hypothetical protein
MTVVDTRWPLVRDASQAVQYGLHDVADKIARVIEKDAWRRFLSPGNKVVEHATFASFVVAEPPRGLHTKIEIIRSVCRDTPYALDLVDQALQRDAPVNQHDKPVNNGDGLQRPRGNARRAALRRLREQRPDLHAEVLAGDKTAHAAMIEAGFRQRTMTVPVDPERAAATIERHFTRAQVRQLVKRLTQGA